MFSFSIEAGDPGIENPAMTHHSVLEEMSNICGPKFTESGPETTTKLAEKVWQTNLPEKLGKLLGRESLGNYLVRKVWQNWWENFGKPTGGKSLAD